MNYECNNDITLITTNPLLGNPQDVTMIQKPRWRQRCNKAFYPPKCYSPFRLLLLLLLLLLSPPKPLLISPEAFLTSSVAPALFKFRKSWFRKHTKRQTDRKTNRGKGERIRGFMVERKKWQYHSLIAGQVNRVCNDDCTWQVPVSITSAALSSQFFHSRLQTLCSGNSNLWKLPAVNFSCTICLGYCKVTPPSQTSH